MSQCVPFLRLSSLSFLKVLCQGLAEALRVFLVMVGAIFTNIVHILPATLPPGSLRQGWGGIFVCLSEMDADTELLLGWHPGHSLWVMVSFYIHTHNYTVLHPKESHPHFYCNDWTPCCHTWWIIGSVLNTWLYDVQYILVNQRLTNIFETWLSSSNISVIQLRFFNTDDFIGH